MPLHSPSTLPQVMDTINRPLRYVTAWQNIGIWRSRYLHLFLAGSANQETSVQLHVCYDPRIAAQAFVGWGLKPSGRRAQRAAHQHQIPCVLVEDGFLRSIGLGKAGWQPISLVVDDVGVYFDARYPSRLEQLITQGADDPVRTHAAMTLIRQHQLSKYNHAPVVQLDHTTGSLNDITPIQRRQQVLVVDQTFADQSVLAGGADATSFARMLAQACQDYPDAVIWVKTHPDVAAQQAQGYLTQTQPTSQIRCLRGAMNPIALLEQMDVVYVVTSQLGFEALMLGKRVYCFGMPWYAGWGLTDDTNAPTTLLAGRRGQVRTLSQLFYAAYIQYARYVHPATKVRCTLEDALQWLAINSHWNQQLSGTLYCVNFSLRKQLILKEVLHLPAVKLRFSKKIPSSIEQPAHQQVLLWGNQQAQATAQLRAQGYRVWQMEDGFVRSIGLGAALVRPMSLVLDDVGIYYDPRQSSRLEDLLQSVDLSAAQQAQAVQIRQFLITHQLSKYNLHTAQDSTQPPTALQPAWQGQRVILVPGQVEDDASVLSGTDQIRTNLALLQAVRQQQPEAWIVYKPHPDVVARLREGHVGEKDALMYANRVVTDVAMTVCLAHVQEVHTMTSLTGFEALIRGVAVTCYGLPFYAGWGLTTDMLTCPRRQKHLSMDTLLYVTLVEYPIYVLPYTYGLVNYQDVFDSLSGVHSPAQSVKTRWHRSRAWLVVAAFAARVRAWGLGFKE